MVDDTHHDYYLHPSDHGSSDTGADSEIECINPPQCPIWKHIDCTLHWDNCLAGKPIGNEYVDIFDDVIYL